MNSATFHSLLKNSTHLLAEEVTLLREWGAQYPYCQAIHVLLARGARDLEQADAQGLLHHAAVYAGDRTVVKNIMTAPRTARVVVPVIKLAQPESAADTAAKKEETKIEARPVPPEITTPSAAEPVALEGDALRADLDAELHRLHHLMSAFEATYEQVKHSAESAPPPKAAKKSGVPKSPAPPEAPEAPIIEEIKSSKRKPKLVSPKVAEQGEIIDHFIKVAPTLPRTKPAEPTADLAAESVNYGDHIVSETLVEILLKQGKKAKAIEMLKKLIWKFPQKKAYFAAQIDALKS